LRYGCQECKRGWVELIAPDDIAGARGHPRARPAFARLRTAPGPGHGSGPVRRIGAGVAASGAAPRPVRP
ncbi:hypothetical protein, partial [Streptomyces sp. NPDC005989]|uniref:hypothetical protein n=1 Tax=Streptomyces sp. NPDC005989 TaxID=3156727 RepID=UPI0033C041F7